MEIKEIYTITETAGVTAFNSEVKTIVNDLQSDGLTVEVQFATTYTGTYGTRYSAMIIGRK